MPTIMRTLTGVSDELSFGSGGSKVKSNSDGVMQITNDAGALGKLLVADGTASEHAVTKSQLDAIVAGAPALLDTLNELAAAIDDDENYASTVSGLIAELNTDVVDAVTALGVAENASSMGTFTGSTIGDNQSAKEGMQDLETAVELRATAANAALTGTTTAETINMTGQISSTQFNATGSGHIVMNAATGNDFKIKLVGAECFQLTSESVTGNPVMTAKGGSGEFKFNQVADFISSLKLNGTEVTATGAEVNYLSGVSSAIQTQINTKSPSINPSFTEQVLITNSTAEPAVQVNHTNTGNYGMQMSCSGYGLNIYGTEASGTEYILLKTGDANSGDGLVVYSSGKTTVNDTLTVNDSITVTGTVDGRDIAADGTSLDGSKLRYVNITYENTAGNFGAELPAGCFVEQVSVKVTTPFTGGSSPALTVGSSADATGFANITTSELGTAQRIITNDSTYGGTVLASNTQAVYSLSGSPTAGAATIAVLVRS